MAAALPSGTRVVLQGLKMRSEYNGRVGVVVGSLDHTGRYLVKLLGGEDCSLRAENLAQYSCDDKDEYSDVSRVQIGSRVMLRGLAAQPEYNYRVGLVRKFDSGRWHVRLCRSGEEVAVRTKNLEDANDAAWSAGATSSDAAVEVLLKAVAFLSKFDYHKQNELIAKMMIKDKFDFMREGGTMHAYFRESLELASAEQKPQVPDVIVEGDTCSHSLPNLVVKDSGMESRQIPTFSFKWGKGEEHCVENEVYEPSDDEEQHNDLISDSTLLESNMFCSSPPKIFPVRASITFICTYGHSLTPHFMLIRQVSWAGGKYAPGESLVI
jgi:hypothetical protein